MKLEFSQHIFTTSLNFKFRLDLSSGSRNVPFGRTDEHANLRRHLITKFVTVVVNLLTTYIVSFSDLNNFIILTEFYGLVLFVPLLLHMF